VVKPVAAAVNCSSCFEQFQAENLSCLESAFVKVEKNPFYLEGWVL